MKLKLSLELISVLKVNNNYPLFLKQLAIISMYFFSLFVSMIIQHNCPHIKNNLLTCSTQKNGTIFRIILSVVYFISVVKPGGCIGIVNKCYFQGHVYYVGHIIFAFSGVCHPPSITLGFKENYLSSLLPNLVWMFIGLIACMASLLVKMAL